MKLYGLILCVLSLSTKQTFAIDPNAEIAPGVSYAVSNMFHDWMSEFGKMYTSVEEEFKRTRIWKQNHDLIEMHNTKDPSPSYTLGHNQFSDMTLDEFHQMFGLGIYKKDVASSVSKLRGNNSPAGFGTLAAKEARRRALEENDDEINQDDDCDGDTDDNADDNADNDTDDNADDDATDIPTTVNWVDKGAVTNVKNQGMCGSCWAFSAIGAIESARFLATGDLTNLSEQELLDCDSTDAGCQGGLMDNAFLFDERDGGLCSDEEYPYVMHKHWIFGCSRYKAKCTDVPSSEVDSFVDIRNTTKALMKAIVKQPVAIAIEADTTSFQFYKSGVYVDECGEDIDHGVLAAGYGTEDGVDYWLVKNSWGESWGDEGYIKIGRDSENDLGSCGILSAASFPIMKLS